MKCRIPKDWRLFVSIFMRLTLDLIHHYMQLENLHFTAKLWLPITHSTSLQGSVIPVSYFVLRNQYCLFSNKVQYKFDTNLNFLGYLSNDFLNGVRLQAFSFQNIPALSAMKTEWIFFFLCFDPRKQFYARVWIHTLLINVNPGSIYTESGWHRNACFICFHIRLFKSSFMWRVSDPQNWNDSQFTFSHY